MKKGKNLNNSNFSSFIFNELMHGALAVNTKQNDISNLLNLSSKDISKIEKGEKELKMKEIHILCKHVNIHIDTLYDKFVEENKLKKF